MVAVGRTVWKGLEGVALEGCVTGSRLLGVKSLHHFQLALSLCESRYKRSAAAPVLCLSAYCYAPTMTVTDSHPLELQAPLEGVALVMVSLSSKRKVTKTGWY